MIDFSHMPNHTDYDVLCQITGKILRSVFKVTNIYYIVCMHALHSTCDGAKGDHARSLALSQPALAVLAVLRCMLHLSNGSYVYDTPELMYGYSEQGA